MTVQILTAFFMWCTIINFGLLIFSSLMIMAMADWAYSIHSKWFNISRETFDVTVYSFLGLYKLAIFIFNLVPWVALLIIG